MVLLRELMVMGEPGQRCSGVYVTYVSCCYCYMSGYCSLECFFASSTGSFP